MSQTIIELIQEESEEWLRSIRSECISDAEDLFSAYIELLPGVTDVTVIAAPIGRTEKWHLCIVGNDVNGPFSTEIEVPWHFHF